MSSDTFQMEADAQSPGLIIPFSVAPYNAYDDRLFRHITFQEEDLSSYRLTAVNQSEIMMSQVLQKKVELQNSKDDQKERFRVKAVLLDSDHGIKESHWVMNSEVGTQEATSHNQYRIRGVSKGHWTGDWVYSELRGFDNELIIYNMLHDILDIVMTSYDGEIEKMMDYIVEDVFTGFLKEHFPQIIRVIETDEDHKVSMEEVIQFVSSGTYSVEDAIKLKEVSESFSLFASLLKNEFNESVMTSKEEFSELYRTYKLFDQIDIHNTDFVRLLVDIFLEDRYKKLVEKTNIEVLMHNEEQTSVYLNGSYEFDIKGELIRAAYEASLDDHFVSRMNDAVQLISESDIFENFSFGVSEEAVRYFNMAIKNLYAPVSAIEDMLIVLEKELEEQNSFDIKSMPLDYVLYEEDMEFRTALFKDIMEELFPAEDLLDNKVYADFAEKILSPILDEGYSLLLDYKFEEVVNILLDVSEKFHHGLSAIPEVLREDMRSVIFERLDVEYESEEWTLKEVYHSIIQEYSSLMLKVDPYHPSENKDAHIVEKMIFLFEQFKKEVQEEKYSSIVEEVLHRESKDTKLLVESVDVLVVDQAETKDINTYESLRDAFLTWFDDMFTLKDINSYKSLSEAKIGTGRDMYYNIFKHNVYDNQNGPSKDHKVTDISPDIYDDYIFEGSDKVDFALGDINNGFSGPLGEFILGRNTLTGEV